MLSTWRLTFALSVVLLLACAEQPTPDRLVKLTPSTILHANFNTQGHLVIGTLQQVAVYSPDGEITHLLDLPRARASWHPIWLNPNLIAIKDDQEVFFWHPTENRTSGPWRPANHSIRGLHNVQGRLVLAYANGMTLLQKTPAANEPTPVTPEFSELPGVSAAAQQMLSDNHDRMYTAYAGGILTATNLLTNQLIWRQQLEQYQYVRAMTIDTESLFVIMQQTADPFARGQRQSVIQLDLKSGKVIQVSPLHIDSQAASALVDDTFLYIGGSENCVFAESPTDASVALCYPPPGRWGEDSGQVIALYQNADKLFAVSASGHLQIWRKQDIVSLITDK